jgi:hypothetical protein
MSSEAGEQIDRDFAEVEEWARQLKAELEAWAAEFKAALEAWSETLGG